MQFALGYIAGVSTCAFLFSAIAVTGARRFVDRAQDRLREVAKKAEDATGRPGMFGTPRGFVEVPLDDDELARQEIIEENNARGLDTPIASLR